MRYESLSVAVEQRPDGGYQARALASPFGPGTAPFALPLRRAEFETLIREAGACVLARSGAVATAPARDLAAREPACKPSALLVEAGARLFRALLGGPVRESYLLSRGRIDSHPERGLRIRVVLPVDSPDAGLLQAVPWELLHCTETREFLARGERTPVVRILPLPWASVAYSDTAPWPLRVLLAIARPRGAAFLDAEDERDRILAAWGAQRQAEVEILPACSLGALAEALRSRAYQMVHVIAHGVFDPRSGAGALLFEAADGGPHLVPGAVLGETLGARRDLRAVFLNACRTSQAGFRPGQDPLLATAAALVRAGVPAALAMQFPITDGGARIFSEAVYRSLARGGALDEAIAVGRLALVQADPESCEWFIPTLFAALTETDVFRPLCSRSEHREVVREEALERIGGLLAAGDFERARQAASAALELAPDTADLHHYLALALLAGRRPRHLRLADLRPIEAAARRGVRCPGRGAHQLCLLAYLVQDFYLENHLSPPADLGTVLDEARAARRDPVRLAELVALVPALAAINARLGEPTAGSTR